MELKAENGLVYAKDGTGWTAVASCITGTSYDNALAEQFASVPKMQVALRVAREAIGYAERVPGFLTAEELDALELIAEALGKDFDPD